MQKIFSAFPPHSVFLLSRFFRISDTEIRNAEIWNFAKNKIKSEEIWANANI